MRALRLPLLLLVLLSAGTACDSPTAARPGVPAGEWIGRTPGPVGTVAEYRQLRLLGDGTFRWDRHRMGGDGLAADRVSSYAAVRGTWTADPTALRLRITHVEEWRHTDGLNVPPRVDTLAQALDVQVRHALRGDTLTLRWTPWDPTAADSVEETYERARYID